MTSNTPALAAASSAATLRRMRNVLAWICNTSRRGGSSSFGLHHGCHELAHRCGRCQPSKALQYLRSGLPHVQSTQHMQKLLTERGVVAAVLKHGLA